MFNAELKKVKKNCTFPCARPSLWVESHYLSAKGAKTMGFVSNKSKYPASLTIATRAVIALIGGYVLANLAAIALSYLLPGSQANGVMAGMQLSFLIYTAVVIWVFTVSTTKWVWMGLLLACLFCAALVCVLMPSGVF
ncbi:MAG: hypothetical protein JKY66_04915 [Spongiibacteraceae bacterium]|nr:hypothetical protein [Spongiibacteraceae bacterium]